MCVYGLLYFCAYGDKIISPVGGDRGGDIRILHEGRRFKVTFNPIYDLGGGLKKNKKKNWNSDQQR